MAGSVFRKFRIALPATLCGSPEMNVPRSSAVPQFDWRLIVLVGASLILIPHLATADPWYEHYSNAEQALEDQNWTLVVAEINEALEKKGDSGARVRSYGMNVVAYFPYFRLGVAYYHLGQFDAALQAFETEARLGAIAASATESADLERYRTLVQEARTTAAADEALRIGQIVERSLSDARDLEGQGLLSEAMAALDQALAVAPDDTNALDAMAALRQKFAEQEREQERDQRVSRLVEDGRTLLRERQYGEASRVFREALFLEPGPDIQELLDEAQGKLLAELELPAGVEDQSVAIAATLDDVRALESAGQLAAALDRLQTVLVLEPTSQEARSIQSRLLQARKEAQAENARQVTIAQLLADAKARFEAGSAEESLSAANRVLALDPGNDDALVYVAQAYAVISRKLLGSVTTGNIPPAVRFVDLRQEGDDGILVQTIGTPDFRLNGVIIDNSPVEVIFYDSGDREIEGSLNVQPLGEFYLTEFNVESSLSPGGSTFRLVATDLEGLVSSSEYVVVYARPFYRAPWFYGLVLGGGAVLCGAVLWRRSRRRVQLRTRRFNPYVAGAPVLDDDMFFGRHDLVARILQTIHNNSLLIYGERRIGKTSIQHQLKKRLLELDDPKFEFHPVYVDLQGTPETRFFQTIAEDIFQELAPVLDGLKMGTDESGDYSYRDFVGDVRAVLKTLEKRTSKKVRLVLLIDEVDELNDYDPRINQKLRSLFMKNFAESLVAVVSGVEIKKQWEREGSPWYNFFEEIEVKPFGPQEARELIERPIGGMFKVDGGVVEKIISLTAGKPYLIQKICISLVTRLHEQRRRRITVADVEAVARPKDFSPGIFGCLLLCVLLQGCGGGSSGSNTPPPPPPPVGSRDQLTVDQLFGHGAGDGQSVWNVIADPTCPPEATARVAEFEEELANRLPVRPWSELPNAASTKATLRAGFADTDLSMVALLMDGELFIQTVDTRSGPHPWPEWMRHGVYSVTKTMGLGLSMFYLAHRYGDGVFDELITDHVPELAAHPGWQNVTFHQTLNMVTGTVGGESGAPIGPFILARSAADKIAAIETFPDAPTAPGAEFAYYSTHSFVMSYAMNNFVQAREGMGANYWEMVKEDVLMPIGIMHMPISRSMEAAGAPGVPIMGWGSYPDVDAAAKIAQLLQDDGVFQGQQLLSLAKTREAVSQTVQAVEGYQSSC